jgi:hypothetical protein
LEATLRRSDIELPFTGALLFIMSGLLGGLILIILSVIGGLIAVPLLEKRKDGTPPAPPPPVDVGGSVGGSPGGYAA